MVCLIVLIWFLSLLLRCLWIVWFCLGASLDIRVCVVCIGWLCSSSLCCQVCLLWLVVWLRIGGCLLLIGGYFVTILRVGLLSLLPGVLFGFRCLWIAG